MLSLSKNTAQKALMSPSAPHRWTQPCIVLLLLIWMSLIKSSLSFLNLKEFFSSCLAVQEQQSAHVWGEDEDGELFYLM